MKKKLFSFLVRLMVGAFALCVVKIAHAEKAATSESSSSKIDLNTAGKSTLESLPGIGETTAQAIVDARPFTSVNDLERVQGIGSAKMKALRGKVMVSHRTASGVQGADETSTQGSRKVAAAVDSGSARRNPSTESGAESQSPVNLNTASRAQLETLPEIGPVRAQAIIDARPFASPADVMRVKDIKQATYEAIKDRIVVR